MQGFYKIYRSSVQPQKSTHKYSLLEAHNWLAANAAWADHRKKVHGKWVTIRKNSVLTSLRQLSLKWNRNRRTIERYLSELERVNVLEYFSYNKRTRTLEIFLAEKVHQSPESKNRLQATESTTTILNNGNDVLEKSAPVPLWVDLVSASKFKYLPEFSTVVYNKEEEVFIHNTGALCVDEFNKSGDEFMKSESDNQKPKFKLVPRELPFGISKSDTLPDGSRSESETPEKQPPQRAAPLKPFRKRIGEPKPFPRETDSPILLTDKEVMDLNEELGGKCLMHLVESLADYRENSPKKFNAYQNHYRVILRWHEMKEQKGLVFCPFHSSRPGYYPKWIYEQELAEYQKRISPAR